MRGKFIQSPIRDPAGLGSEPVGALAMVMAIEPPGDGGVPRQPRGQHAAQQHGSTAPTGGVTDIHESEIRMLLLQATVVSRR